MTGHTREIDAAVAAHDQWKARSLAAIEAGSSEFTPEQVAVDDRCAFGKWFYLADA